MNELLDALFPRLIMNVTKRSNGNEALRNKFKRFAFLGGASFDG